MRINKTIIIGVILILFAGLIFVTDIFNPIIRPITYLFLMGSSKGKDIIFFGLLGLFLILSQAIKKEIDTTKFLKISIIIGAVLLILGIVLEVVFRLQMGIGLNTVFCSMTNKMSSTSILHTHLLKAILGEVITKIMGPFIQSDINTGAGLYAYVPSFGFLVILLIPILFVTLVLSMQKRPWFSNFFLAFFSSCLIIGAIDGGLWGTPALVGILGLYLVYRNGYYYNYTVGTTLKDENLLEQNELQQPPYENKGLVILPILKQKNMTISKIISTIYNKTKETELTYTINRIAIYVLVCLIILLRFTIAFAGAEPDYYTVEIVDIADNVDFGDIPITHINNTTYHVDSSYNEMQLINDLKIPLNNSCEYYTVSWNIYSYFVIR